MITKLLDVVINEIVNSSYYITEIQLGKTPMKMFVNEVKSLCGPYNTDITQVTHYKDIMINWHDSNDAILYNIAPKKTP